MSYLYQGGLQTSTSLFPLSVSMFSECSVRRLPSVPLHGRCGVSPPLSWLVPEKPARGCSMTPAECSSLNACLGNTPYQGLHLTNQKSQKLGGKWPEVGGKTFPILLLF